MNVALSAQERMQAAIDKLPILSENDLPLDDACPICLLPFKLILHPDPPSHRPTPEPDQCHEAEPTGILIGPNSLSEAGVTRIDGCGHLFCKRDLIEWISSWHGTCPSCRHPFAELKPPSESDDESSDGGEYVPDDTEDDVDAWDDHDYSSEMDTDYEIDFSPELEDELGEVDTGSDEPFEPEDDNHNDHDANMRL